MTSYRTIRLQGYTILVALDERPADDTYPRLLSLAQPEHDLIGCSWKTCEIDEQPGSLSQYVRVALAPTPGKSIDMRRFSNYRWMRLQNPWPGNTSFLVSLDDWNAACVYEAPQWLKDRMTNVLANSSQTTIESVRTQLAGSAAQRKLIELEISEAEPLGNLVDWNIKKVPCSVVREIDGKLVYRIKGELPDGFDEHADDIVQALAFWRRYGIPPKEGETGADFKLSSNCGIWPAAGGNFSFGPTPPTEDRSKP